MALPVNLPRLDPLLHPFVEAVDEVAAEACLNEIIERNILPQARAYVRYKFGSAGVQDGEDLAQGVALRMCERLRQLRARESAEPIKDLANFLNGTLKNAWKGWLNERDPARASLKNRLRYLLQHDPAFTLTERGCIRSGGVDQSSIFTTEELVEQVWAHHPACVREPLPELVAEIMLRAEGWLSLNDLVTVVASLYGIKEPETIELTQWVTVPAREPSVETQLEQRNTLRQVWAEIEQLLPLQRAALLLNFRDERGRDAFALFLYTRVATLPQLAAAVGLTPEQFAEISLRLPLSDEEIAAKLGVAVTRVGNLRKAARERLARRLVPKIESGQN